MNLAIGELLDYTIEEQDRWEKWFAEHGEAPLDIPLQGDPIDSLRILILHFIGGQMWFAERLLGRPATEYWKGPNRDSTALFEIGRQGKRLMREVLDTFQPEDWKRIIEMPIPNNSLRVTARKAALNSMIHEVRHWAQVATIVRQHGMAPPGNHDLILSHALE